MRQITLVVLKSHIWLNFNKMLFKGTFVKGHVHFFELQQKKKLEFLDFQYEGDIFDYDVERKLCL